jgi:hypothetical protein
LFHQVYEHAISKVEVVRFLRHLLHQLEGKLTVIWDGLPAHRSRLIKEFLAQGAAQRLNLVQLQPTRRTSIPSSGYGIIHLKRVQLGNVCCTHLAHLRCELRKAVERVRLRTTLITRFFHQPGYL